MNKIKFLREKKHMTQTKLGKMLNVTQKTISSWETEKNDPDIKTLKTLATIFNCTVDEVIDFDNTVEEQKELEQIKPVIKFQSEAHQECVELINKLTEAQVLKLSGYIEKMLEDNSSKKLNKGEN